MAGNFARPQLRRPARRPRSICRATCGRPAQRWSASCAPVAGARAAPSSPCGSGGRRRSSCR
eukprot:1870336-Alexandrium_andersonii.AAC.1